MNQQLKKFEKFKNREPKLISKIKNSKLNICIINQNKEKARDNIP
jgi:hypothetical protein